MNQEALMKLITEEVLKYAMANGAAAPSAAAAEAPKPAAPAPKAERVTKDQYPLGEKMADRVFSPTGKRLSDMKIEQIYDGTLTAEDMRIAPETLEMQAQVAESVGNDAFAFNLRRAAELIAVPDDRLLEIYNALRPYRSTKQELIAIAEELENKYNAKVSAALVRESAEVYEKRKRLKRE